MTGLRRIQAGVERNRARRAVASFFNFTLQRDFEDFALLRVNRPRSLPVVLSRAEVKRLLDAIQHPVRRMPLTTIYALGLRLGEGLHLQSSHIDSARQMVWVRSGKGAKDRRVPLPKPLLLRLRHYWKHERPASTLPLLFVSAEGKPIHETTLLKTFESRVRWDESGKRSRKVMPNVAKNKSSHNSQAAAPVTALATRDRVDVPTAKRRAGRRSGPAEAPTVPAGAGKAAEDRAILPPLGENPGGAPTRSETQSVQGAKGRMTMRIVALDLEYRS